MQMCCYRVDVDFASRRVGGVATGWEKGTSAAFFFTFGICHIHTGEFHQPNSVLTM